VFAPHSVSNLEQAESKALSDFDFAQQLRMWTTLARLRA
jgi:hypothetical protein